MPTTALIDGEIAAMWGVVGTPIGDTGVPWLMTSPVVYKTSPIKFARIYKSQVKKMINIFPYLVNFVDSRYNSSMKMLRLAGFNLDAPEPHGPNGELFCRFWMRAA